MEDTNPNKPAKTPRNKSVAVGLAMLALGCLIGAAAMKYARRGAFATPQLAASTEPESPRSSATGASPPADEWNPYKEMRRMQAEMDKVFQLSVERFRLNPQLKSFREEPGYSLSLDVRDLNDRFEVRASLPDVNVSDVKANLENNQTLKVAVTHNETEKGNNGSEPTVTEWGRYEQTMDLPAPVKADQIKVERKDHDLLIILPKA